MYTIFPMNLHWPSPVVDFLRDSLLVRAGGASRCNAGVNSKLWRCGTNPPLVCRGSRIQEGGLKFWIPGKRGEGKIWLRQVFFQVGKFSDRLFCWLERTKIRDWDVIKLCVVPWVAKDPHLIGSFSQDIGRSQTYKHEMVDLRCRSIM